MSTADWTRGNLLLLGSRGMLARDLIPLLQTRLASAPGAELVAVDKEELDITDRRALIEAVRRVSPRVVINTAACTDVDGCEARVEEAMAVNAQAPAHLGEACQAGGSRLVHLSSDFIFDGQADRPYRPEDAAQPLSVYGQSKWEGEQAVRASGCHYLILRTSWLFGLHGRNFVEAILARARAGETLRVVDDQVGRPTFTADLGNAILRLLDVKAEGLVHFANAGQCSWHQFAEAILREAGLNVPVQAISSRELGRPARRPAYSVLDLSRYTELTGQVPPAWPDALHRYFQARRLLHSEQG